jgi:hypothetical protein
MARSVSTSGRSFIQRTTYPRQLRLPRDPQFRGGPDSVLITFHFACDEGDLEVAEQLVAILEHMQRRPPPAGHSKRRTNLQPLVAARERLWSLRHPEARND